jgi:hypothetical protein
MSRSGICTVLLNPPAEPSRLTNPAAIAITVVPEVAGCPLPSNVVTATLAGVGNPLLQMQGSGQTLFMPLPRTSAGRSSGQVIFGESAGGAYTPQPVTLEISVASARASSTRTPQLLQPAQHQRNYNSDHVPEQAVPDLNSDTANATDTAGRGESGQYYINARWTYSSCAFGASICGFAIQFNDGPY